MMQVDASDGTAAALASLVTSLSFIWEDLSIGGGGALTLPLIAGDQSYFSAVHQVLSMLAYHDSTITMAASAPTSVDEVISSLPPDRRPPMDHYRAAGGDDGAYADRGAFERAGLLRELCVQLQAERLMVYGRSKRERSDEEAEKCHVVYVLRRIAYYLNIPFDANAGVEATIEDIKNEVQGIKEREGIRDIENFQPKIFFQQYPDSSSNHSINSQFNGQQIVKLKALLEIIEKDFYIRRSMLLKRLDVTMDTFIRSKKLSSSDNEAEMTAAIRSLRQHLSPYATSYGIHDILSAPLFNIYEHSKKVTQTSHINKNKSFIKTLLIGSVPDRGGRVGDAAAPKKESFVKNSWGNNSNSNYNNKNGIKSNSNNKNNSNKNRHKDDNKKRERSSSQGSGGDDKKVGRVVTVTE